jgi:hypothetical protein
VEKIGGGGFSSYASTFMPSVPLLSSSCHLPTNNSVYRAVNRDNDHVAACKIVLFTPSTSEIARKNAEKEMRVHAVMTHANVLKFCSAVIVEQEYGDIYVPGAYMLLELAVGGDLFDKIGEWVIEAFVGKLK